MLLEKINTPSDLKNLSVREMEQLADEIRHFMLDVISERGGH
ncbi:MAG TPA: 1-deoxy-D-xylulose-5-phosphate synthase N-terminal domain-containing protein, partial [Spirochaetota bacterium]|nr:1-deoxy-D-xylulose-5-phosphate synthase N-terminal domain-containing protein [Spirochaetota bacterium]